MTNSTAETWGLRRFLDAVILELDRANDTLAYKGPNRKMTYMVKDLALDIDAIPSYVDDELQFVFPKPGYTGKTTKLSIQLGSITDRQIFENTRAPVSKEEIDIDEVDVIDEPVKKSLKELGIRSVEDVERLERQDVNVKGELARKAGRPAAAAYKLLAKIIRRGRRDRLPPQVKRVSLSKANDGSRALALSGENLVIDRRAPNLPAAELDGRQLRILESGPDRILLSLQDRHLSPGRKHALRVALDPDTFCQMAIEV